MENCTIYSHQLEFEKVVNIVKESLPKAKVDFNDGGKQKSLVATIKGGLFGKTKTLKINYRERENPSYKLDKIECGLTQNLAGMMNFIQSLPSKNDAVKNKFLIKVASANCEMPFMAEPTITKEFEQVLHKIVAQIDGYVFAQPNQVFKKSNTQHFVDKNFNLILDANGNCEVQDIDVSVDAKYHDQPTENYTEEQLQRKTKTEHFLQSKNIKVNKNLPCLPSAADVQLRNVGEVVDRVYALMITAAKGEGIPRENLEKPIKEKRIDKFSPKEQLILDSTNLSDQQKAYATWRYESLNTLLWALNIESELKSPNEMCDVGGMVSKILKPTREEFDGMVKLKSKEEILDELDIIYRINWACVDARIKGQQVSGNVNPSIIYERHYALNWLTNYQDQEWDNVQTNT